MQEKLEKIISNAGFQIYSMGGFKDLPLSNVCIDFLQYSLILSQCGKKFSIHDFFIIEIIRKVFKKFLNPEETYFFIVLPVWI